MLITIEQLVKCKFFTFEYVIQNQIMTISRIAPLGIKHEMTSFNLSNVEKMGLYTKDDHQYKSYEHKVFACKNNAENSWYFKIKNTYGNTLLVLTPDERLLESIKPYIPKHLSFEVFVRGRK